MRSKTNEEICAIIKYKMRGYLCPACRNEIKNALKKYKPSKCKGNKKNCIAYNTKTKFGIKRSQTKPTKFLGRIFNSDIMCLTENLRIAIIENIAEDINGRNTKTKIKRIKGKEITKAYKENVGNNTCMTGSDSYKTRFYAMNPDKINMLIAENGNRQARCILWKLDCGRYYADKIYYNSPDVKKYLREYVRKKGYFKFQPKKSIRYLLKVSNLYYEDGSFPYLDSLIFAEEVESNIINLSWLRTGEEVSVQTQSGEISQYFVPIANHF